MEKSILNEKNKTIKFNDKVIKDRILNSKNFFLYDYLLGKNPETLEQEQKDSIVKSSNLVKSLNKLKDKENIEDIDMITLQNKYELEYKSAFENKEAFQASKIVIKESLNTNNSKNRVFSREEDKLLTFGEYRKSLIAQSENSSYEKSNYDDIILKSLSLVKDDKYVDNKSSLEKHVSNALTEFKENDLLSKLPEKYRLDPSKSCNNNTLMLSLYDNYNELNKEKEEEKEERTHKKWKLYRVISGHTGWVRCVDVDPTNNWFVTGSVDKIIKFWDLASGTLKLSLTGHINTVRDLKVSKTSPFLFSGGEDGRIKCWDLEKNQVFLDYHGHLSGVYSLALHLNQDILVSGGRDSCVRVWDIRTKKQITALEGHNSAVTSVLCNVQEPQIMSSSLDSTIRFYDIRNLKTSNILTYHKKSIRSIVMHDYEQILYSGGCDRVKQLKLPSGEFVNNMDNDERKLLEGRILNTLAINKDDVLVGGYDDGRLKFWDCKTGNNFQTINVTPQSGSLDCESGIFGAKFDLSSSRLITTECDKTIKMWKEEDENELDLVEEPL